MNLLLKFFFIYLLMISSAWAQPSSFAEMQDFLSLDIHVEIKTADFVDSVSLDQLKRPAPVNLFATNATISVVPIDGKNILTTHAILDIDNYIRQRLGQHVVTATTEKGLQLSAFAGTTEAFYSFVKAKYPRLEKIVKIPSIYEEWGIAKYLLQADGKAPILYFNIPPSLHYAQHYATMIKRLNPASEAHVFFDNLSIAAEKNKMAATVQRIKKTLLKPYDIVSFGYGDVWLKSLQNSEHWILVATKQVSDNASGVSANLIELKNKFNQRNKNVLLISSQKTVWGELASFMLGAFLHPQLESVIFMGSAGAVSKKNSVYDLSVPEAFVDQKGKIRIDNIITKSEASIGGDNLVNFGARHGNTFSPIEQDMSFLKQVRKKRMDTIDVEQSLLARTVAEFNLIHKTKVGFGAVNLITDKPYNILRKSHADFDLDRIDQAKKQAARLKAVNVVLDNLNRIDYNNYSCQGLFK